MHIISDGHLNMYKLQYLGCMKYKCIANFRMSIYTGAVLRSSLIRIYTVWHSFYIFWRHYFNVKLNCFILRTTAVAGLGVPIFRVISPKTKCKHKVPAIISSLVRFLRMEFWCNLGLALSTKF